MEKKIFKILTILVVLFPFISCNPIHDNLRPTSPITSEELTKALTLTPKEQGNNNLEIKTIPTRYIKVFNATTNQKIGEGTIVSFQVVPPATEVRIYVETMNYDGSITKSGIKSLRISKYTDLSSIFNHVFGNGKGGYTTTYWTWDSITNDGNAVFGQGKYMIDNIPIFDQIFRRDINEFATENHLSKDGSTGWFSLDFNGITTSRGERGTVTVSENPVKAGWDIGTITFSKTIPLIGIVNNHRQLIYQILPSDSNSLYLCAPEQSNSEGKPAYFWRFRRTTKSWCDSHK